MYLCSCHDHDGGYAQDCEGIHHITFAGVIEAIDNNPLVQYISKKTSLCSTGTKMYPIYICMYGVEVFNRKWIKLICFFSNQILFYVTSQTLVFRDTNSFYKVWFFYVVLHVSWSLILSTSWRNVALNHLFVLVKSVSFSRYINRLISITCLNILCLVKPWRYCEHYVK